MCANGVTDPVCARRGSNTRQSLQIRFPVLSMGLALLAISCRGTIPDPLRGSCLKLLSIVETLISKCEYLLDTYAYKSHISDTEPASQWMAENPNVHLLRVLTGRALPIISQQFMSLSDRPMGSCHQPVLTQVKETAAPSSRAQEEKETAHSPVLPRRRRAPSLCIATRRRRRCPRVRAHDSPPRTRRRPAARGDARRRAGGGAPPRAHAPCLWRPPAAAPPPP